MGRRHRQRRRHRNVQHSIGNFFHDPLGAVAHSIGGAVKEIGHSVGGFVHDIIGGASTGVQPLIQTIGTQTTGILAGGVQPVLKTAGEAVATDLTALGTPLQALQLPLMIGAGVVALMLIMRT